MPRFPSSLLLLTLLHFPAQAQTSLSTLQDADLKWLGEKIFTNECNQQTLCLTSWNQGEDFPSLGIGHFIWYRDGQQENFQETFPALLEFMQTRGIAAPAWISHSNVEQPWPDRDSFLAALNNAELTELRSFLQSNMAAQSAFIAARFTSGLERMLQAAPADRQQALRQKADSIIRQGNKLGLYALIDYVHFKGEGILVSERYADQGWGLLQVLENMPAQAPNAQEAFVLSAREVLTQRVANAPPQRNEQRWLKGWMNRLDTYLVQE